VREFLGTMGDTELASAYIVQGVNVLNIILRFMTGKPLLSGTTT